MLTKNSQIKSISYLFFSFLFFLCFTSAFAKQGWSFSADDISSSFPANKAEVAANSNFYGRYPAAFVDDVTEDQDLKTVNLTKEQQHQALVWGLTQNQEKRYVLLMQNKSGIYFKDTKLSPIEILAINARTDKERDYYAALDAEQEFQKIAKIEAFDSAYHNAALLLQKKLNIPVLRKFDYSKYSPYNYQPLILRKNDKLMLLVKPEDSVRPIMSSLMASVAENPTIQLNVYFVGENLTKNKIFAWAKAQNIPPEMVDRKEITLNFGDEQFKDLQKKQKDAKTPSLILIRAGKSILVDTGRF